MTQKELAYVEDAIGHEETIISILNESKQNMQSEELVSFLNSEEEKHKSMKERLMNLLEEKVDE